MSFNKKDTKSGNIFIVNDCPKDNINTSGRLDLVIGLNQINKTWPPYGTFRIRRNSIIIFVFNPYYNKIIKENNRINITFVSSTILFVLHLIFFDPYDAGQLFEIGFLPNDKYPWLPFCSKLIEDDMKPKAFLIKLRSNTIGFSNRDASTEGDTISITCHIVKGKKIPPLKFGITFPRKAIFNKIFQGERKVEYSVKLTRNIRNKSLTCWIINGYNDTRWDLLNFELKTLTPYQHNQRNIAIALAVMFCLIMIPILPLGCYVMIYKSKKDHQDKIISMNRKLMKSFLKTLRKISVEIKPLKVVSKSTLSEIKSLASFKIDFSLSPNGETKQILDTPDMPDTPEIPDTPDTPDTSETSDTTETQTSNTVSTVSKSLKIVSNATLNEIKSLPSFKINFSSATNVESKQILDTPTLK